LIGIKSHKSNVLIVIIFRKHNQIVPNVTSNLLDTFAMFAICMIMNIRKRCCFIARNAGYVGVVGLKTFFIVKSVNVVCHFTKKAIILVSRVNWNKIVPFAWMICILHIKVQQFFAVDMRCIPNALNNMSAIRFSARYAKSHLLAQGRLKKW